MLKRKRKKIKIRFYFIIASLALILCISLATSLKGGSTNASDISIPVIGPEEIFENVVEEDKPVICLDPGHGGHDTGTESVLGFYEKDINLKIALQVGELLEKENFEIIFVRTTDEAKGSNQEEDLKARCEISNEANADVFVSIHCNFDKVSPKTKGLEVWCRYQGQKGEELATCLDEQLAKVAYTRDRGLKYEFDGSLYILKNTKAVSALVELGFLSNTEDSSFLNSVDGQKKCSEAIAQAIKDYIQ